MTEELGKISTGSDAVWNLIRNQIKTKLESRGDGEEKLEISELADCISFTVSAQKTGWLDIARSLHTSGEGVKSLAIYAMLGLTSDELLSEAEQLINLGLFDLSWSCTLMSCFRTTLAKQLPRSHGNPTMESISKSIVKAPLAAFQLARISIKTPTLESWLEIAQLIAKQSTEETYNSLMCRWLFCVDALHLVSFSSCLASMKAAFFYGLKEVAMFWLTKFNPIEDDLIAFARYLFANDDVTQAMLVLSHVDSSWSPSNPDDESLHFLMESSSYFSSSNRNCELCWRDFAEIMVCRENFAIANRAFAISQSSTNSLRIAACWDKLSSGIRDSDPLLALRCRLVSFSVNPTLERVLIIAIDLMQRDQPSFALVMLGFSLKHFQEKARSSYRFHLLMAQCLDQLSEIAHKELVRGAIERASLVSSSEMLPLRARSRLETITNEFQEKQLFELSKANERKKIGIELKLRETSLQWSERNYESIYRSFVNAFTTNDRDLIAAMASYFQDMLGAHEATLALSDRAVLQFATSIQLLVFSKKQPSKWILALEQLVGCTLHSPSQVALSAAISTILTTEAVRVTYLKCVSRALSLVQEDILDSISANTEKKSSDGSHLSEDDATLKGLLVSSDPMSQLSTEPVYRGRLRRSNESTLFRRCEISTLRKLTGACNEDSLEAAIFFYSLSDAAEGLLSTCVCLLQSARFLLLATIKAETPESIYSAKKGMMESLMTATYLSVYAVPHVRLWVARYVTSILVHAVKNFSIQLEAADIQALVNSIHTNIALAIVFPAPIPSSSSLLACDAVFIEVAFRSLTEALLASFSSSLHSNRLVSPSWVSYLIFEGRWRGWIACDAKEHATSSEELQLRKEAEEESREVAMRELLLSKSWEAKDVEKLLQWFPVPRDSKGFLLAQPHSLDQSNIFHSIDGFEIDLKTGNVKLLMTKADCEEGGQQLPGLFGWRDVAEVLGDNIAGGFLSFNDPGLDEDGRSYPYHPFQGVNFGPESLRGSQFLATLLHTDYLLKVCCFFF